MTETPSVSPPSSAGGEHQFDFGRPFVFVFEDRDWLGKILIGGLFYLAAVFLVGIPFLLGYGARLARNVIRGADVPLPEWSEAGEMFVEGLKLAAVALIYLIPQFVVVGVWAVMAAIVEEVTHSDVAGGALGCLLLLLVPFMLLIYAVIPAALVRVAATGRFEEGFNFRALFSMISGNFLSYLLAMIVYLLVNFIAQFGVLLVCVGVLFTSFWSSLATTHAFAQVYREWQK